MEKNNNNRNTWLHVRLTEAEHQQIRASYSQTECRKLSEYARKILLGKPMIGRYRNTSMDDFMAELIRLRLELNTIGNNFNQLVKRLHMADRDAVIMALLEAYETDKNKLLDQVAAIKLFIETQAEKW